jgi:hypothetical protein
MMALVEGVFTCQFCNHKFSKEKTLMVHVCEKKRRHLAKSEKHVVVGFDAFNRFFKLSQNLKGDKTYEEFSKSPYYNAFVKFGSFVSNVNPLYPDKFIDYIVRSGVRLDHWCRDELYDKYVVDLIKTEPVEVALERSIKTMIAWGEDNNAVWNHYFLYASPSRIMFAVKDGKISPWLILNSNNGKNALKEFDDTQLQAIGNVMDLSFWLNKFKRQSSDVALVKQVVKESNI